MTSDRDSPRRLIVWTIAIVALAIIVLWAAYLVRAALLLVYVSGILAIGFSPLVRVIQRQGLLPIGSRRFPRWLAILLIYLAILGALTSVILTIVPPLVTQARDLWAQLPTLVERGQGFLLRAGALEQPITLKELIQQSPANPNDLLGGVVGAVWGVMGGLFGLVTVLILTFYFLIEAPAMFDRFLRLIPAGNRARIAAASAEITNRISAWLVGQLMLATIIGVTSAIGLWLLGVPFFYVLALLSAIGEVIPMVGPILAAIPAIAVGLSVSLKLGLFVTIFYLAQQQLENHLLVPKLMEHQVGISAVTVIIALLIGGSLLGVVGAILSVPTAAILIVMLEVLIGRGADDRA